MQREKEYGRVLSNLNITITVKKKELSTISKHNTIKLESEYPP